VEITRDYEFERKLIQKIAAREFHVRTGVHCSDLLYCLNKQGLRRAYPRDNTDNEVLLFSLGWSTQRWLTHSWEDEPSMLVDGILVTMDALSTAVDPEGPEVPWELKATFTSKDKPLEENVAYIRQTKAQAYCKGVLEVKRTRFEVMGNWKSVFGKKEEKDLPENQKPTLSAWNCKFTKPELVENWKWMKWRRDLFKTIVDTEKVKPKIKALLPKIKAVPSGQAWECNRCPFLDKECTFGCKDSEKAK